MKRPEGFDKAPAPSSGRPSTRSARSGSDKAPPSTAKPGKPAPAKDSPARRSPAPERAPRPPVPERAKRAPAPERAKRVEGSARPAKDTAARAARREAAAARREASIAAKQRRRYERQEVKRFTRRQRSRRIALGVTLGTVGVVVVLVLIAIFSPILSLRTVTVEGASRVDAGAVAEAVEQQLGTPLALIDYGRIDTALREFPIIRSYRTETIPPGTIVVHVTEREPVVSIAAPAGDFLYVDAAGVTVERSPERLAGVPLVTESGATLPNPAFDAAVEVLLAMPDSLRSQLDTIQAKTRDDVWLTLAGVTQAVKWGSADDSATKVRLLEVLQATFGQTPGTFDVSATSNGIFRPA